VSNYVKSTDFASKDNLSSGDPLKIVKGTEIDTEFNNIATAVATKADLASPTFTGTVTIPTVSLTNDLPVTDGGTGASTAADARTNLSAAKSGANSDITSLSGLTTALSVAQGGTGATSASSALSNLGAYSATNPNGYTNNTGTVTSIATGNGLSGGTITTSGTLSLAAPSYNTVGSYVQAFSYLGSTTTATGGDVFAAGSGTNQIQAFNTYSNQITNNLSGTWRWMGATTNGSCHPLAGICVRVS
jgi:hypothetical protein